jgi:hypothetical protein
MRQRDRALRQQGARFVVRWDRRFLAQASGWHDAGSDHAQKNARASSKSGKTSQVCKLSRSGAGRIEFTAV